MSNSGNERFSLKKFLKSIAGYSVASWAEAAVAFITIPIITRIYSTDEYGRITMLLLAINIGVTLIRLSTEQSYIRFYYELEKSPRRSFLTQCITICLSMFALLYIALIFFYEPLSQILIGEVNTPVLLIFIPVIALCIALGEYQRIYFKMNNLLGLYIVFMVGSIFSHKISMLIAAAVSADYYHAMLFMAVSYVVVFIAVYAICPACFVLNRPKYIKEEFSTIMQYALPFLPVVLLIYLNNAVSSLVLKSYFDYGTLAIFSATVSIANIMAIFQSGFAIYWGPFVYKNYKTQQGVIKQVHTWLTFCMTLIALGVLLISDVLFYLLGPDYRAGRAIFGLLIVPHILTVIAETTCYGIYLAKKTYLQIISSVFSIVGNITISILLIPQFGLLGAAIANACGAVLSFIVRTYFGQREYSSTTNLWRTFVSISILCVAGIVYYFFSEQLIKRLVVLASLVVLVVILYSIELRGLVQKIRSMKSKPLR